MRVQMVELARWRIGQTVAEADAGIDRLRALYSDLDDAAWAAVLERFAEWRDRRPMRPGATLGGKIALQLVTATLPR